LIARHVDGVIKHQARAAAGQQQRGGGEKRAHLLETLTDLESSKTPGQVGDLPYLPNTPSSAPIDTQIAICAKNP